MSNTKQETILKCNTLEEAEKKLYELVKSGINFREIAKTGFDIAGNVKRFNPSQISKIKAKFEPKPSENHLDQDKSKVFALFKKNKKPTDVIIETGLSYEFVKKSYEEFLEFEKKVVIPKYWLDNLEDAGYYVRYSDGENKLEHIRNAFITAKDSHLELESHIYYCCKCEEPIPIKGKTLQAACDYLSQNWGHAKCIQN